MAKSQAAKDEESKKEVEAVPNTEHIILNHVGFGMVAGAIPLPVVDIVAVTAIQMDMLSQLAKAYKVDFNLERGKSLASSIMGAGIDSFVGRFGHQCG